MLRSTWYYFRRPGRFGPLPSPTASNGVRPTASDGVRPPAGAGARPRAATGAGTPGRRGGPEPRGRPRRWERRPRLEQRVARGLAELVGRPALDSVLRQLDRHDPLARVADDVGEHLGLG